MSTEPVEDFLAHYGVLGMRWGFRKQPDGSYKRKGRKAKSSPDASDDHKRAQELRKKAGERKPRASTLSNKELQQLIERQNLEQQYSRLNPTKVRAGEQRVKTVVATVGTVSSVIALAQSPAGKAAAAAIKKALKR